VSSSRIRALIAAGDVAQAASLLGRFHRVRGKVVHGRGFGRELGAPTANLHVERWSAVPAAGVYAARALVGDRAYAAGVAIGPSPTFRADALSYVEAHLIGFTGELYAQAVTLEFVDRIRDQRAFDSAEELAEQIQRDLAAVTDLLKRVDAP
jgi:riboflavin kinase/FMN adenylyltransferase